METAENMKNNQRDNSKDRAKEGEG